MKHIDFSDSSILQVLISRMRNKELPSDLFSSLGHTFSSILAYSVTSTLPTINVDVTTPLTTTSGTKFEDKPVLIPILRAGLSMLEPFNITLTSCFGSRPENGFLAMSRDESTAESTCHYTKLPDLKDKIVIVLDPMLATGGSAALALNFIHGCNPKHIIMASILAAPEGIQNLSSLSFSENLTLFTGITDSYLNENKFIVPGLGDYGDRFNNS